MFGHSLARKLPRHVHRGTVFARNVYKKIVVILPEADKGAGTGLIHRADKAPVQLGVFLYSSVPPAALFRVETGKTIFPVPSPLARSKYTRLFLNETSFP